MRISIIKKENSSEKSSSETVVRYMDYRAQADERRKELASLRKKCLANSQASRLSTSEAPKEMAIFLQKQREIFEQERMRRKEARDLMHGFNEEDGIPPSMSREEEDSRREEAFAFMSRYRAAKHAIMRSTEAFWQDANKEENASDSLSPMECARRWDSSNRELDNLIEEIEITLSCSSEDNGDVQAPFLKGGKGTWTVIWLSLMTMCATNVVGLVLSVAMLNFNLRPGTAGFEDLINILGDGNFYSMCRELLEAVQESSDIMPNVSFDYEFESSGEIVQSSLPRYKGVYEEIYERLRDNLDQWMFDSATTFRQALTTIRYGSNAESRLHLPALVSPNRVTFDTAGNNEGEIEDDNCKSDSDSMNIIDVPALLLRAQDSIHQLLLETKTVDISDDENEIIDLDFDVPEMEDYVQYSSSSLEFTRDEAFDIAKLISKAKAQGGEGQASMDSAEMDDHNFVDIPMQASGYPTVAPVKVSFEAPVADNRSARESLQSNLPFVASSEPVEKRRQPQDPNGNYREQNENFPAIPSDDDRIIWTASSDSSTTSHPNDSIGVEIEYLGDIYETFDTRGGLENTAAASKEDTLTLHTTMSSMDQGDETKDTTTPQPMETKLKVTPLLTLTTTTEIEHGQSRTIGDSLSADTKEAASEDDTPSLEGQPQIIEDPLFEEPNDLVTKDVTPTLRSIDQGDELEDTPGPQSTTIELIVTPLAPLTEIDDGQAHYEEAEYTSKTQPIEMGIADSPTFAPEETKADCDYGDYAFPSVVPDEVDLLEHTFGHDVSPKMIEIPAEKSRKWDLLFMLGAVTAMGFGASIALSSRGKR